ncbi:MAG: hypothetical protein IPI67_24515 [Myxococcales bacterium]|nr:hypothetical protein [Myxococcales bacterium]
MRYGAHRARPCAIARLLRALIEEVQVKSDEKRHLLRIVEGRCGYGS